MDLLAPFLNKVFTTPVHLILSYVAIVCGLAWAAKSILHSVFYVSPLRNVPGPRPQSWFKGNLGQLFNRKGLRYHHDLVESYGGVVKVYGFFGDEQLYISDPRALHSIVIKDQDAFEETSVFIETNKIVFGEGLVATTGEQHKRQRKIVNPVFSVPHLRQLTPIFYEVADRLSQAISNQSEEYAKTANDDTLRPLNMAEWMSRVALETIGQTTLGYSFDPLNSPHNNPYTSAIKGLIPALFSLSLFRQFAPFLAHIGSPWFRRKVVELTPIPLIQRIKNMSDVMYDTAKTILHKKISNIDEKEDAFKGRARDIISALLRENNRELDGEKLSEDELIGQITVLIFGAQDTSSSALSRMLYMLSTHQDVQENVRQEIKMALDTTQGDGNGHLNYDDILALPWLDAVVKETLRLYPPVPFVRRTALEERTIPLSQAVVNPDLPGAVPMTSVTIPAGTTLFVGIGAANRLQSVWGADAKEWKPSRWLESPSDVKATDGPRLPSIYSGMLTFLGGHRACIGYKFAQIEIKILLATLLSRFSFAPTEDEVVWNLSQIISPSVRVPVTLNDKTTMEEKQGLPLIVRQIAGDV